LARSHLLSSIPYPYQGPDDPSIARSPSSRFRVSGQLIKVQAQLIFVLLGATWCFFVGPLPALVACFLPSVIRVHAQI
jgi:hypothetical protein